MLMQDLLFQVAVTWFRRSKAAKTPRVRNNFLMASCVGAFVVAVPAAWASAILQDQYYGGLNTYNGADVIGPTSVFDITSALIARTNSGDTLVVTIYTDYAGVPGTSAADGTGYGVLFITPGADAWNPSGTAANHYSTDQYVPGEWQYAATIPQNPGASSGSGGLFLTSDGTVVNSNVNGNPVTYPFAGNPGYYFRQGQAVQFVPNAASRSVGGNERNLVGRRQRHNLRHHGLRSAGQ